MIRKLRIALANWIMPKSQPLSVERTAEMFREIMAMSAQRAVDPPTLTDDFIINCVRNGPRV